MYGRANWIYGIGGAKGQVKWDRLYNRSFDNSKINKFIDTSTFEKTIPALTKSLNAFLDDPKFKDIDWVSEAMKDRMTGDWVNIKEISGIKPKLKYIIVRLGLYNKA